MQDVRENYKQWQYSRDWRTVPTPSYGEGIKRVVDLSHSLRDFPGPAPELPPPAYAHVEPFGRGIVDRGNAFEHLRVEPFAYSDSPDSIGAMVTFCTQMNPQLEGPFLGYLPQHIYGELDPRLKMIAKDSASTSLAQLVTNAAILRRPTGPGGTIALDEIKALSAHARPGDAIIVNTGFLDHHMGSYEWPAFEPGITTWLMENKGNFIFAVDSPSVEGRAGGHAPIPNHMGTWENGGINLEGLVNLASVPVERCVLVALPLKIHGLDAGPCRCLAIYIENGERKVVDISPVVGPFPGGATPPPPYARVEPFADKNQVTRRLRVDPFHVDNCFEDVGMFVTMNTHLGPHVELPHGAGDPDVATYPIDRLVGSATVFDLPVGPGGEVSAKLLENSGRVPQAGDIALVRTGYSDWSWGRDDFYDRSPGFAEDAVDWLIARGVKAVATDCASIEKQSPAENRGPSGRLLGKFHAAGIPVASNLTNIAQIFAERPYVVLAPLRIAGLYVAPVRPIAIEWN